MNFLPVNGLHMLAIEVGLLCVLMALAYLGVRVYRRLRGAELQSPQFLSRPSVSVLLVIALALLGRGVMLPWVGIPQPRINDEFSYLLMGDTFAHGRLTNPTPPDWQHFETFHVNFVPTYHSKYPVSQGLALAVGEVLGGQPWIGVYLSTALMCGAICWALQAFVPPAWALLGGLLAVFRIALFSYWMNSYWGGSMAALGGALALGAVVRVFERGQSERRRMLMSVVFGFSLLLLATSRPFEGFAFSLPLMLYFAYQMVKGGMRRELTLTTTALPLAIVGMAGLLLIGHYNRRTTGNRLLMPYVLNERTYAQLPLFFGQRTPTNVIPSDPVFQQYYLVEASEHGFDPAKSGSAILKMQLERLASNWFFYVGPALSLPILLGLLLSVRERSLRLVLAVTVTTGAAVACCVFSQAHYFAPATVAVYVFAVVGLKYFWDQQGAGEQAFVIAVCGAVMISCLTRQTGSATINAKYAFPDTRRIITSDLEKAAGKQLVLVSYDFDRHYPGDELVHNGADFNAAKILWARSKGSASDMQLCSAYSDRKFWSVTTDDVTFSLKPLDLCETKSSDQP